MQKQKTIEGYQPDDVLDTTNPPNNNEENKFNPETRSRFEQRKTNSARNYHNRLEKLFIDFKNKYFIEKDGFIDYRPEIIDYYKELNHAWKEFCHLQVKGKHRMIYSIKAFEETIRDHVKTHSRLCWINHCMRLSKQKFGIELKFENSVNYPIPSFKIKNVKRMHTLEIPDIKYFNNFPSELEEMNPAQFQIFCELLFKYMNDVITVEQFKTDLFLQLCKIKISATYNLLDEKAKNIISEKICALADVMDSFFIEKFENGKTSIELNLNIIKNLLPKISKRLYGPADALTDITWCEYRNANMHYRNYLTNRNESDLDKLIAVLYRPRKSFLRLRKYFKGFDGQERIEYTTKSNPVYFEKRLKQIAKLPFYTKFGIFIYFSGCERFLREGNPIINGVQVDFSLLYSKEVNDEDASIGLTGLLYSLAETKVFGDIEQTDNQDLYDIMFRMYQVMLDRKKQLKKAENDKNKRP